jgi:hypothetical protein
MDLNSLAASLSWARVSPPARRFSVQGHARAQDNAGFTIAQRREATFVTRFQPARLPRQAARQLPDQSRSHRLSSLIEWPPGGLCPRVGVVAVGGQARSRARTISERSFTAASRPPDIGRHHA